MKKSHFIAVSLRRRFEYLKLKLGIYKSEHVFRNRENPVRISILIPDSLGDIAVNSSVTQYFKARFPGTEITLITHPKYLKAGYFDPNYDVLLEYPPKYLQFEPWALSYQNQFDIAKELTPDMDRLYLCQPSSWCDHVVTKHNMLNLQNRLCKVPLDAQFMPKLRVPVEVQTEVAQFRATLPPPVILLIREAYTANYHSHVSEYWKQLAAEAVAEGYTVLDNSKTPIIDHEKCLPVGEMPLAKLVALARLCDGVVALRSGMCDLIGFAGQSRQYVLYPEVCYPFSRMSFLSWCSLAAMGVDSVTESENSFRKETDVAKELERTRRWLGALPMNTAATS